MCLCMIKQTQRMCFLRNSDQSDHPSRLLRGFTAKSKEDGNKMFLSCGLYYYSGCVSRLICIFARSMPCSVVLLCLSLINKGFTL